MNNVEAWQDEQTAEFFVIRRKPVGSAVLPEVETVVGTKDVPSSIANWDPAARTCNAACHQGPPAGMYNPAPWYF